MIWVRRNSSKHVTHTRTTDPAGFFADDIIWYEAPDGTAVGDYFDGANYFTPTQMPPLDIEAKQDAQIAADSAVRWYQENTDRVRVGATPIIQSADQPTWDAWMKEQYDAIDSSLPPPEPPAIFRQATNLPDQDMGQCVIEWFEFTGTWPGWGFKALFKIDSINSLGLKVYDESGGYLYALTFTATDLPNEWVTETPAGYATATKVQRSFEIISGSAPVTNFLTLDDSKDRISLVVKT